MVDMCRLPPFLALLDTYMRIKNLYNFMLPGPKPDTRNGNALSHIPIPSPKRRGPTIERILQHGRGFERPAAEDGEPAPKGAAVIELAVG